ncbi:MAG: hypothetical protein JSS49_14525 [Planctomycetes bacterium]|nr:hypothetical protein [Planctomycetota bacterium]
MSLSLDLAAALTPLIGQTFVPARAVAVADGSGVTLSIELLSVEALGVSCEELRLEVPALGAATLDVLKKWGDGLCKRVTYLLENLGPLEYDATSQEVLIRSTPPDQGTPGTSKYYEVLLSSHGAGRFSLRRFRNDSANPGRIPVPIQVTHEQLAKLVNDLTATIPNP